MDESIASFDVFDTLLTRAVGEREAVSLLLGLRLATRGAIPCSAEVFSRQWRLARDRAAQETSGDPPLKAIHAELARALLLAPGAAAELAHEEKALEFELIRPVPGAHAIVQAARERGDRVVFVSDTNFLESDLRELLDRHGLRRPDERCFASSELHASKHRGSLYPIVERELGISPDRLLHHGDHPRSDLRHAAVPGGAPSTGHRRASIATRRPSSATATRRLA